MFDIESMMEQAHRNAKRDEKGSHLPPIDIARLQAAAERLEQVISEGEERRREISRQFAVHAEKLETEVRVFGIVTNMGGTKTSMAAPKTARFQPKPIKTP